MSREMEYEKRVLLNKEQYEELVSFYLSRYPNQHFINQTNSYFDTFSFTLKNRNIVFRLRNIGDQKMELTLKIKKTEGDEEITQRLTYFEGENVLSSLRIPEGEIKEMLLMIGISFSEYHLIGSLKTKRLEIPFDDYLVVIDENSYFGIVDYNLEIESSSKNRAKSILLDICQSFDFEYKKDYLSKSSRLIEQVKNKQFI